ncbi:MAG TPA: sulfatase [Vicinamibacteria bacterium]|nr:sulfatase [Vicinamibacteria bacterium]
MRSQDLLPLVPHGQIASDVADLPLLVVRPYVRHDGFEPGPRGTLQAAGNLALVRFRVEAPEEREAVLRCRLLPEHGPRMALRVSLNGHRIGDPLELTPAEAEHRVTLPAEAQRQGPNELRFAMPRGSRRRPALEIVGLSLRSRAPAAADSAPGERDGGFWLPPRTRVGLPVVAVDGASLRVRARGGSGPARLVVTVQPEAGPSGPLESLDVSAGSVREARRAIPPGVTACLLGLGSEGAGVRLEQLALEWPAPSSPPTGPPGAVGAGKRPDVVVYVVDTLRADEVGAYGQRAPTTPRFDAFARDAVLFEDATAQSSWTRPSVATLLTGLGAETHGVGDLTQVLAPEAHTLAEVFQAAGYRTAAFNANGVFGERGGYGQGFDPFQKMGMRPARELVDAALEFVKASNEPAFVYIQVLEPHRPYSAEPVYWEPFAPYSASAERRANALTLAKSVTPAERELLLAAYRAEVRQADAAFGRLLDGLESLGRGRAVVALTADHGDELFDRGAHGHGYSLYQEALRVPLAIGAPGARAARVQAPVQHADLPPTLLALAGLRPEAAMEGRDLSPLFSGGGPPDPDALLVSRLRYRKADKVAVRRGRLKLIVNLESGDPEDGLELFDLGADPAESRNLASARPILARALLAQASLHAALAATRRASLSTGRRARLTEEQERELRALGYVE